MNKQLHLGKYRVHCQKGYQGIYKTLKGNVFNEYHNLFTLCVFLGKRHNSFASNERKKEQLFWSDTFTMREYAAFYSLIIHENKNGNYSLLKNGEKTLEFLENYADGGMKILLDSEIIKNHVKEENGEFSLDISPNSHIQKQILYYVYSLYRNA
jgi:hypothetical protein